MSMHYFRASALTVLMASLPFHLTAQSPARPHADTLTVTVHEGTHLVAALSPNGQRIAFILLGQVFLVDAGGGHAIALTDVVSDPHENWAVAWAHDSRRLAVTSKSLARMGLRVIDADSRTTVRSWDRYVLDPVWSSSDRAIMAVEIKGDSSVIWNFAIDSTQAPALERALPRAIGEPSCAPDGRFLAYAGPISAGLGIPNSASDLWEMDVATGAERRLTSDSTLDGYPVYSPDGRWLAFTSERSGSRQLWVLPRHGGQPRPLTANAEEIYLGPLSWLPDSRGVLYTAAGKIHVASLDGSPDRTIEFAADIAVAHWSGLRRPVLPQPGERRRVRGIVTPALSPDGKRVAFAALGDLRVAGVDGGRPVRLTRSAGDHMNPRWSPDGSRLAYAVNAPGKEREVRVLEVAHPERSRVVPVPTGRFVYEFEWSPDGRRLAWVDDNSVGWTDAGTGETRVVAAGPGQLLGWSIRGDTIAFSRNGTIWHVSADSSRSVASNVSADYALRAGWSPDLSKAAYVLKSVGYFVDVAGGKPAVRITDPAPRYFTWSADGLQLLYLSGASLRLLDVRRGVARTLDIAPEYTVTQAPRPLLIRNVRIVDGRGGPVSALSDVLVAGGRIAAISRAGTGRSRADARTIDAGGRTLLPGLFNNHAHQYPGKPLLSLNVYNGVLAIRDPGASTEWMQSQRERSEAGELLAPRIFATGGLVVADFGQNNMNMRGVIAADPKSVADEITSMVAVGADIIKPYFRNPILDARVSEAAHAAGLPMTSHFLFLGSLARGLEGKEHDFSHYRESTALYREDFIATLRAADVCLTATLVTYPGAWLAGRSTRLPLDSAFLADPVLRDFAPPSLLESARAFFREPPSPADLTMGSESEGRALESMRRVHEAGIRIPTGTDLSDVIDEFGVPLEMEMLVLAGFTPLEAIRAATFDAASCLGVENELGSVEVGKRADLIIVDGDPTKDIRDIRHIAWALLGGAPYTREEIVASVRRTSGR